MKINMKNIVYFSLLFFFSACNQKGNSEAVPNAVSKIAYTPPQVTSTTEMAMADASTPPESAENQNINLMDRMLIRTGDLRFRTDDITKTKAKTKDLIAKYNSILTNESYNSYDYKVEYNYQIKVPQLKFDSLYNALASIADKLEVSNINATDVTEEFVDVSARLKTKKSLEERYQQILKSAKSIKEMLEIERELNNVRAEIESMQSRLNSISKQVQYSVIQLGFYEEHSSKLSGNGFFSRLGNSFTNSFKLIGDLVVNLVYLWPIFLMIIGVIWWLRRRK
jgi:DNA-binding FrmR family transcriptional regulator